MYFNDTEYITRFKKSYSILPSLINEFDSAINKNEKNNVNINIFKDKLIRLINGIKINFKNAKFNKFLCEIAGVSHILPFLTILLVKIDIINQKKTDNIGSDYLTQLIYDNEDEDSIIINYNSNSKKIDNDDKTTLRNKYDINHKFQIEEILQSLIDFKNQIKDNKLDVEIDFTDQTQTTGGNFGKMIRPWMRYLIKVVFIIVLILLIYFLFTMMIDNYYKNDEIDVSNTSDSDRQDCGSLYY
jgi:hypothetical protein